MARFAILLASVLFLFIFTSCTSDSIVFSSNGDQDTSPEFDSEMDVNGEILSPDGDSTEMDLEEVSELELETELESDLEDEVDQTSDETCEVDGGVCVDTAECPPGTRTTWTSFGCTEPKPYCCKPENAVACEAQGGYCESPVSSACYQSGYEMVMQPLGCDEIGGFCCLPINSDCEANGGMCIGWAPVCPETHYTDWTRTCDYGQCCTPVEQGMCRRWGGYCQEYDSECNDGYEAIDGGDQGDAPNGCPWERSRCCLPSTCPKYVAALADCPYQLIAPDQRGPCYSYRCLDEPCRTDADCPVDQRYLPADKCVTGNCVFCWNDSQCPEGQLCRSGRCIEPDENACILNPACSQERCGEFVASEVPCPVCDCDSSYSRPCSNDMDCLVISSHPYSYCVNGRCTDCRNGDDCHPDLDCIQPGVCHFTEQHISELYGTWLLGVGAGMDHFSYFRFEPDGTLRRGAYQEDSSWSDDMPPLPCYPAGLLPMPLIGTWGPEFTQSTQLSIRMSLNVSCDEGSGWSDRYYISFPDDLNYGWLYEFGTDYPALEAHPMSHYKCSADFSHCLLPSIEY